jgi:hypothetical protein
MLREDLATADKRVRAPVCRLRALGWIGEGPFYIDVKAMRHEMWRNHRFTLFSPS